ncbi:MAG: cob(I)yrinic acid a,c-diamide adenosyltransferase, partial [Candidatus Thiodiazotropha sp. (ex Cardiolucina cf. quadrata)]|nr:cob(I)yrinic acid a,c-diamide adenosyltransferase [Candidatus Thiodiazotropha sp. (ex Cardiolucina cf. quadrata)]
IQTSREIWTFCQQKIRSHQYDLVVLDEINYCCKYGWISGQEIANFIQQEKPSWMHLILTGQGAPAELIDIADTVTEMRKIKHAFEQGIHAEQGMEF